MLNNLTALLDSGAAPAVGDYESIATVTVGAGGSANVSFTSIVGTYKHLELRMLARDSRATYGITDIQVTFNSDTAANYSWHLLMGDGASATADAGASSSNILLKGLSGTSTGVAYGAGVFSVLDYANTNKYKTTRALMGTDVNGTVGGLGGRIGLSSGSWRNTAAVTSITLTPLTANFTQYSSFALYGVK
jgi:hypothetical protein